MILTNRKRDLQQRKALNSWSINGFNGSIIAGTGFGKSRLAVLAIDYEKLTLQELSDHIRSLLTHLIAKK